MDIYFEYEGIAWLVDWVCCAKDFYLSIGSDNILVFYST